jgi:hypothetical protein
LRDLEHILSTEDIAAEQKAEARMARGVLLRALEQIERSRHSSAPLPQDDLISSPKDFNLLDVQSKSLWQPNRLTIS